MNVAFACSVPGAREREIRPLDGFQAEHVLVEPFRACEIRDREADMVDRLNLEHATSLLESVRTNKGQDSTLNARPYRSRRRWELRNRMCGDFLGGRGRSHKRSERPWRGFDEGLRQA